MAKRTVGDDLIEAMGDAVAHAKGEIELPTRIVRVPEEVDVAAIRKSLDLSQGGFAERFGFKVAAVRDWEQGRRQPERSARILLTVIDKEHEAVERALAVA
jgi:putative transcriptional regulator